MLYGIKPTIKHSRISRKNTKNDYNSELTRRAKELIKCGSSCKYVTNNIQHRVQSKPKGSEKNTLKQIITWEQGFIP